MPELQSRAQLADTAKMMASSFELVQRASATFIPAHWETGAVDPPPPVGERIWMPMSATDKRRLANVKSHVLFATDSDFRSFDYMLRQLAQPHSATPNSILIKTTEGLRELTADGQMHPHDGVTFVPNYVRPVLNDNPIDKALVYNIIVEWLGGSEEEADSLLSHLATSLAPGYSAVKYILLLGEGRNGKSVLLTMVSELFGRENISNITRQMMAERNPTCAELNDKLLNIVFDGEQGYIRDSSMEKTLIAGEPGVVRMLYESGTTHVQTNALFIEALNREPKVRDKSSALQKRLVRFKFPNIYEIDKVFSRQMTSPRYLGALLALLIEHFVPENELAERLKPTQGSLDLQVEQVYLNSPVLQFIESLDDKQIKRLIDGNMPVDAFLASFKPWMESQGNSERSDADLLEMMKGALNIGWKTLRIDGKPKNTRMIREVKPETLVAINQLKGEIDGSTNIESGMVGG